ncbi:MAG: HK97 family phage prohead protease [Phycisphaerales bacterium]
MTTAANPTTARSLVLDATGDVFRLSLASEIRAERREGSKSPVITGKIRYDVRSKPIYGLFVEIVRRGAFGRALRGEDDPRALMNHDSAYVLGRRSAGTLRLMDDSDGLRYEFDAPDTTFGRDLVVSIDRGDIRESSFGFRKIQDQWSEERTKEGLIIDIRELLEVELLDLSPVAYPAYPDNTVAKRCWDARQAERRQSGDGRDADRARRLRLAETD